MPRRRPTISDVALRAGVAKGTVSAVLNGRGDSARITSSTQERIRKAAAELDYRPSAVARMLATRRSHTLGLVMQYSDLFSSTSSFMNEVMRGVCSACTELGYDLMLHTREVRGHGSEFEALADGRVDAVLALRDQSDELVDALSQRGLPCVMFFCRPSDPAKPFVDVDNRLGARLAVEHLAGLGHRRIAMYSGGPHSTASREREEGFEAALRSLRLAPCLESIRPSSDIALRAECVVERARSKEGPTAYFVWSDDDARRLCDLLGQAGFRAPYDFSVVGFDSTATADLGDPPLTSIRQPIPSIAREAARIADSLISSREDRPLQVVFAPVLDVRASTRPPAESARKTSAQPK